LANRWSLVIFPYSLLILLILMVLGSERVNQIIARREHAHVN